MRKAIAGLLLVLVAEPARAEDPIAPPPRMLPPELLPAFVYPRRSAYDVWQNYAVDRRGFYRARVIDTPYGAFYRYNGQPYPWTTTTQYRFTPEIAATPYRTMPAADE
jgi:hypothetical protein